MQNIRTYNASFSFISFKANQDTNIYKGNIYPCRIKGQIHHKIGPLLSSESTKLNCAQIYFYDGQQEEQRLKYSNQLNPLTLIMLQAMLLDDCQNPYCLIFKKASTLFKQNPSSDIKICRSSSKPADRRVYNKPTQNEIAIIMPGFSEDNDVKNPTALAFPKNGNAHEIDPNKACYDSLQYPLIYPFGELSYEYNTIELNLELNSTYLITPNVISHLINDEQEDLFSLNEQNNINEGQTTTVSDETEDNTGKNKMKYVSAMQYYAFVLCDRTDSYIHRFGRLFHQFIVDQFSKIEHTRLNFFRLNQDKIRADLYQNIKNTDPQELGKNTGTRIVLPSTYKGIYH